MFRDSLFCSHGTCTELDMELVRNLEAISKSNVQFSLFKTMILSKRICTAIYVAINERFGPLYP